MKYEYMKESEQMLQYFQFPKFLLKLRISQTAKYLYMILYDRARISRKNSWIDKYGNVYLIFPIEELSVQIDKCKSSVKTALKELDDVGLLVRRFGGFSKPNHLYVKIPSDTIQMIIKKMRGNEVLNIDSTNQVRVENELKSKLYAPMTEEEMLARLKKSRKQGIFKETDRVISNMRSKYGL